MSTRQSSPTPRSSVRASTRGAAAANHATSAASASAASAAAPASAAPRASGRSTPTAHAATSSSSSAASAAPSSASSTKRKRDAEDRAADSPVAGAASASASAADAASDVLIEARSALTTLETIPLCFTSPLYRQGKIIRLTRVHTHATAEAATAYAQAKSAAAASSSAAAASSSAAAASSASPSAHAPALPISPPDTSSYIRASDLAQLFLSSKNAVSAYLASFSTPHEKVLMRVPGQRAGGDVLLFTRKGLKRALLTRQLRADVSLARWVQEILLDGVMAHGAKGMIIPAEAMRPPRSSNDMDDIAEDDDEEGESKQSEEEIAAARKKRMLALPKPNRETLAAWVAASLSTATALHKADSDREAKLAAIAAASPAQQRGGSSAGKNWAGHAFADKRTRVGIKFQALVPDRLTYAQQKANLCVDDPRFADEELIYSPSLPQPRWAPFSEWPRLRPDDPASRRYARAQWDAEQLEARRSTRRMDGGDPGDGVLSLVTGSMAQRFERELAGLQREERIKVEAKLLHSAFRQLNRVVIKQDRGARDFESVFLSSFHEWGSIERIFLFDLPQPGRDLKEEAFEVTAARFVPTGLWTEARDRDAREAAARAAAKRRRGEDGSAHGAGGAGGSLYAPSVSAAAPAAAASTTAPAAPAAAATSSSAVTGLRDRGVHLNGLHPRAHLPPSSAAAAAAAAMSPPPLSSSALVPGSVSASGLYVPSASATRGLLTLSLPQPPPTPRTLGAAATSAISPLSSAPRPLTSPHVSKQPDTVLGGGLSPHGASPSSARHPASLVSPPPSASLLQVRLPSAPPKSKPLNALGLRASLAPPPPSIAQMQQKQQQQQQTVASR